MGFVTNAQTSKESANARVLNEFADKLDNYNIYVLNTALEANDTIYLEDGTFIVNPFQSAWCYFIDEIPAAGWGHPCKYYLVDQNSNRHIAISKDIYPCDYNEYEVLSEIDMNISPQWTGVPNTTYQELNKAAPNEHQWAILVCGHGGEDMKRFWGDLSCVYTTLTNRFGFIENQQNTNETYKYFNHIAVVAPYSVASFGSDLNNSGGYSNQDFFSMLPPFTIENDDMYYNNNNGDYYTKNTLKLIIDNFAGKDTTLYSFGYRALDSLDNLFIYITGHGQNNYGNSSIRMMNHYDSVEKLYDYELSEWLEDVDCSQMTVVMQPCHSGGFVDDLMNIDNAKCKNRAVYTSTSEEDISYAEIYINSIDSPDFNGRDMSDNYWCNEFTFYWSAALLGYYPIIRRNQNPQIGPWDVFENNLIGTFPWEMFFDETESLNHEEYDVSPDTNNDGVVSLDEAFMFTRRLDTWDLLGYYNPYTPIDIYGSTEFPQSGYDSNFSRDFITMDGYKGTSNNSDIYTRNDTKYSLSGRITLGANAKLNINNNTSIYGNRFPLLNYGSIQTTSNNLKSSFHELRIESYGDSLIMSNCDFKDCDQIKVLNGSVDFKSSTFNNTSLEIGILLPHRDMKVTSTSIEGNSFLNSVNAISINGCNNVNVKNNDISARSIGIFVNKCLGNMFVLESNKEQCAVNIISNNIHNCNKGILSYNSNAIISTNIIHDNFDGICLYNLSNTVIMGKSNASFPHQTQEIKNNTNYQIETIVNSYPRIIRYNCISNNVNGNYLIYSSDNSAESLELDVSYNSWAPLTDDMIANKLYATGGYYYKYLPTWRPSIPFDTVQIDQDPPARMLASSDSLIGMEQYNNAYSILVDIVDYYPNTNEAIIAMKSMLYLRYYTDNNYNSLKNYYKTNSVILANSNLTELGDKLANKCDEILQNYDDAIEWYENVIEDENASYEDKVFATIDLGNLYLIIGEEGSKSVGKLTNLVPKSAEQHAKTTTYLLSTLTGDIINKNQDDSMKDSVHNCVVTTTDDNNIKIYIKEGNADITFYNALGVIVKKSTLNEGENIINAEDLKAGVYIWKTSSNNIVNSGKFIKNN